MADIAELGFKVDTAPLTKAKNDIDSLVPSAKKVEDAAKGLGDSLGKAGKTASGVNDNFKKAGDSANDLGGKIEEASTGFNGFGQVIEDISAIVENFNSSVLENLQEALTALVTGVVGIGTAILAAFAFQDGIESARELSRVTAMLSTNISGGAVELERFGASARKMADGFGTTTATQVSALYEAVSAGAENLQAANKIVDSGNKLAIGGISDLSSSVDILTTVTNAYAATGQTAANASDSLFVAQKAGKTTINELASSLGNVVPLAAALGVNFDNLTGATATLTLSGIKTSEAVTGVRATLTAIAGPSTEATKLAKALGIEFNTTALKSKGLQSFLADIVTKTGGSVPAIQTLFGSVEALNAVLALGSNGGQKFNEVLGQLEEKAGATEAAYKTMSESLDFRFNKVIMAFANMTTQTGTVLLGVIVPLAEKFLEITNSFTALVVASKDVGIALLIAFSPIIVTQVYALAGAVTVLTINLSTRLITAIATASSALYTLALANPFTAIAVGIMTIVAGIYYFGDEISKVIGVDVPRIAGDAANTIIGVFDGAYQAIVAIWSMFPNAFYASIIGGINLATVAIKSFLNYVIDAINGIFQEINDTVNSLPFGAGKGLTITLLQKFEMPRDDRASSNTGKTIGTTAAKAFSDTFAKNKDYLGIRGRGQANEPRDDRASSNAGANDNKSPTVTPVTIPDLANGSGSGAKGKGGKTDAQKYEDIVNGANRAIESLKAEQAAVGLSAEAASRLKRETDLLNQAQKANIDLSEGQRKELMNLAGGMASIEEQTRKTKEQLDFAKSATKGFLSDFVGGLKDGKSVWESFGDAASNVLDKIVDKLLNNLVDAIFTVNSSVTGSGSGGGLFGTIGSLIGSFFGSAKGNVFDNGHVKKFAKGGDFTNSIVSRPTMFAFGDGGALGQMGEAGPEAIMPLKRGADGSLGVQMMGSTGTGEGSLGQGGTGQTITIMLQDDSGRMADIADQQIKTRSGEIIKLSVKQVNNQLPSMIADKQRRGKTS